MEVPYSDPRRRPPANLEEASAMVNLGLLYMKKHLRDAHYSEELGEVQRFAADWASLDAFVAARQARDLTQPALPARDEGVAA